MHDAVLFYFDLYICHWLL